MPDFMNQARSRVAIGAGGILVVVIAAIMLRSVDGVPLGPDAAWELLMVSTQWAPARTVALVLNFIGSAVGAGIATIAAVVLLSAFRHWRGSAAVAVTVCVGALSSTTIKLLSLRPRPLGGLPDLRTFSFPSGHTTWAAAIAAALALALPRVWTAILAAGWVALMAWSRTYIGAHWLTDVIAGALLGLSLALIVDGSLTRLSGRLPMLRHRARSTFPR